MALKNLLNGKRVLAMTLTLTMLAGTTMYATANSNSFESQGDVKYQDSNGNSSVLFSKDDLEYLNNKIDDLKTDTENGKAEIASAINNYGYHKNDNVSSDSSYEALSNAIKSSQQIPTDQTFSGVKPGETDETSGTVSAATSENLSLGTAAWVNGKLVIGNGADNKSYYNMGYTQGIADGLSKVNVSYVYHEHTGESVSGGGCYTKPVYHSHVDSCYTTKQTSYTAGIRYDGQTYGDGTWYRTGYCTACGAQLFIAGSSGGWGSDSPHTHTTTSKVLTCTKTSSTIDSYSLGCGKTTDTIESAIITYS